MLARWLATWFGAGLAPVAPGTVGTVAAVPLVVLLGLGPPVLLPLAATAATLVGVWAAGRAAESLGRKDPSEVVIDEVAGYLWACCGGPASWPTWLAAFLLFRLFDVLKPGPVDALQRVPGGWGIVLDDVAAGLLAAALTWLGWGLLAGHWTGLLP